MDKDIKKLQNMKFDNRKLVAKIQEMPNDDIKQLLSVKDSQMFNLRRGERNPSIDGLMRLMTYHNLSVSDLVTTK